MTEATPYTVVYEGPQDDSPETLRQIKGVFIAELDCSIDEVKQYLDETPSEVFSTDNREELLKVLALLKEAGCIVSSIGDDQEGEEAPTAIEPSDTEEPSTDESSENGVVEFSFDLDEITEPEVSEPEVEETKAKAAKVYSLDFDPEDDDGSDDSLSFDAEEGAEETEDPTEPAEVANELNFSEEEHDDLQELVEELVPREEDDLEVPAIQEDDEDLPPLVEKEESIPQTNTPDSIGPEQSVTLSVEPDDSNLLSFDDDESDSLGSVTDDAPALSADPGTPAEPEVTPDVSVDENDLSFSFDDNGGMDLHEPEGFDPNVAGARNENWDLSFDGEQPPQTDPEEPSQPDENLLESSDEGDTPQQVSEAQSQTETPPQEVETELSSESSTEEPPSQTEPPSDAEVTSTEESQTGESSSDTLQSELETAETAAEETVSQEAPSPRESDDLEEPKLSQLSAESTQGEELEAEPTVTTDLDEEEDEDVEAPIVAKSRSGKQRNRTSLLILTAFLLLIGNGYFLWSNLFTDSEGAGLSESTLDRMIKSAAKRSNTVASTVQEKEKKSFEYIKLVGTHLAGPGTLHWKLLSVEQDILSGNIEFSAKKPRELTKLEIATGIEPIPWLHKVEFHNIKFEPLSEGNHGGSGTLRLFIEQGEKRYRKLGHGHVVVAYNDKEDLIAGTVTLALTDQKPTGKPHFTISGNQQNLTFSAEIDFVDTGGAIFPKKKNADK